MKESAMRRVRPGVYRRRNAYVVRFRDGDSRQHQVTIGTLRDAARIKALVDSERREHRERRKEAMNLLAADAALRPRERADLRWSSLDLATKRRLLSILDANV